MTQIFRNIEKNIFACATKIYLQTAFFVFSLIFVLIWAPAASPLYSFLGGDCISFRVMGRGIVHGLLPYHDLFDHKGPLLFYIYALAESFSNFKVAMTTIQSLAMFASLNLIYKSCRLIAQFSTSLIILALTVAFVATTMGDGSQTEFFELPLICTSTYLILKLIYKGKLHNPWIFGIVQGLCLGGVFMLRPNDAASPMGILIISAVVYLAKDRSWQKITRIILGCAFGAFLTIAPFVIYFTAKGIFNDFIYGMFIFNFQYLGVRWTQNYMMKIAIMTFFLICTCVTLTKGAHARKIALYMLLPVIVGCTFTIGNNPYPHYYMVLAPFLAIALTLSHNIGITALVAWAILINGWNIGKGIVFYGSLIQTTNMNCKFYCENEIVEKYHQNLVEMIEQIPPNERSSIWNYNLGHGPLMDVFLITDITPANRFFVPIHKYFVPEIQSAESVFEKMPKWVLAEDSFRPIVNIDGIKVDKEKFESLYQKVSTVENGTNKISLYVIKKGTSIQK